MESRIYAVCFVRDGQYPGCVFTIAVDMDRETAEMIIARELDAYTGFDMAKVVEILDQHDISNIEWWTVPDTIDNFDIVVTDRVDSHKFIDNHIIVGRISK